MKLLFGISFLLLIGCGNKSSSYTATTQDSFTSTNGDSSFVVTNENDTSNLRTSPVKILSAKPIEKEYSNRKDVRVSYKNISDKRITGIRFRWYGVNAFGEPASMGISEGYGSGFDDEVLSPGKSRTGEWDISSKDLKKIIKAWPYEVVFEDGTKWTAY